MLQVSFKSCASASVFRGGLGSAKFVDFLEPKKCNAQLKKDLVSLVPINLEIH